MPQHSKSPIRLLLLLLVQPQPSLKTTPVVSLPATGASLYFQQPTGSSISPAQQSLTACKKLQLLVHHAENQEEEPDPVPGRRGRTVAATTAAAAVALLPWVRLGVRPPQPAPIRRSVPESVGRPDGRHSERPNAPPPESVRDAPSSDEGGPVHQGRKAWIISGSGWRHVVWPGTPNTKSLAAVWNEVVNLLQEQGMISLETAKQMEEWSRE